MDNKIGLALTIYLTALLASNTLGMKLMPFAFNTHLSTAIFAFPIVFLMTDVIGEVYGKSTSRMFVRMGFISTLIFLFFNLISNAAPSADVFAFDSSYRDIFGLSFRFTLASLAAFAIGEYQDVVTFFFLKRFFHSRWFWIRSALSNLWGQLLDSAVWFAIAYAGILPFKVIVLTLIPWWLFKVGMGLLYTPLSYLGIRLLRRPV